MRKRRGADHAPRRAVLGDVHHALRGEHAGHAGEQEDDQRAQGLGADEPLAGDEAGVDHGGDAGQHGDHDRDHDGQAALEQGGHEDGGRREGQAHVEIVVQVAGQDLGQEPARQRDEHHDQQHDHAQAAVAGRGLGRGQQQIRPQRDGAGQGQDQHRDEVIDRDAAALQGEPRQGAGGGGSDRLPGGHDHVALGEGHGDLVDAQARVGAARLGGLRVDGDVGRDAGRDEGRDEAHLLVVEVVGDALLHGLPDGDHVGIADVAGQDVGQEPQRLLPHGAPIAGVELQQQEVGRAHAEVGDGVEGATLLGLAEAAVAADRVDRVEGGAERGDLAPADAGIEDQHRRDLRGRFRPREVGGAFVDDADGDHGDHVGVGHLAQHRQPFGRPGGDQRKREQQREARDEDGDAGRGIERRG